MKKTLTTLTLILLLIALLAGTASAEAGLQNFGAKASYDGRFTDVPKSAWYYDSVAEATAFGLIKGTTPSTASPYLRSSSLSHCLTTPLYS